MHDADWDLLVAGAMREGRGSGELVCRPWLSLLGHKVENVPEKHRKPSLRGQSELLLGGTSFWSGSSTQKRPEFEARCFGWGVGAEAFLALGLSEPSPGDLAFPENRGFLPLSSHSGCPEALGLSGKGLMPPRHSSKSSRDICSSGQGLEGMTSSGGAEALTQLAQLHWVLLGRISANDSVLSPRQR